MFKPQCSNKIFTSLHEEILKTIIKSNLNGIVIVDPNGNILFVNSQGEKIFRCKEKDLLGENLGIPLGFYQITELEIPHHNQELTIVETMAVPIIWQGNNGYLISLIDITEKKKMEEDLQILFQASEQSPASMIITDVKGNIEYVNPKFERISGYSKEEIIGKNPRILIKSGHISPKEYKQLLQIITKGKEWTGEFHNRRKNGELYWQKALISPLINSAGAITHYIAVTEEITQQKQQAVLLEYQAKYDNLTNIPNRSCALEKIEELITQAKETETQFALMFIDLDHFKEVNDNFGHEYGDELLIRATQRMKNKLRKTDFLARLGGDEFLIAIPFVKQKQDVSVIGNKIINSLEQRFKILDVTVSISASIGITFFPHDADNLDKLIKNADIAMYRAKKNGRHQLQFFEPEIGETMVKEVERELKITTHSNLEEDFYQALENEEFKIVYQPIINLDDNSVSGVEVFLRWQTRESRLLYPQEFIPSIENNGMIFALEKWLLQSILAQCQKWAAIAKIPIHINLSVHQFQSHGIIDTFNKVLNKNKHKYQDLVIEIKEQVFLVGNNQVVEILETIDGLNIGVSLDNFGTGISSLTNLHKFPFQSLKIDTTLVNNLENSQESINLAKSIITIAQLLNIKIIAQGIETQEQLNILKNLGCKYGQGYLFSMPLSPSQFNNYLIIPQKNPPLLTNRCPFK